jgi:hypothetical protein
MLGKDLRLSDSMVSDEHDVVRGRGCLKELLELCDVY